MRLQTRPFLYVWLLLTVCNDCINSYKFNCYSVAIAFCKIIACLKEVPVLITALKKRLGTGLEFLSFDLELAKKTCWQLIQQ